MVNRVVTIKMEELEKLRTEYIDKKRKDSNLLNQKSHFLYFMYSVLNLIPRDLIHHYNMGSLHNQGVRGYPGYPILEVRVSILPSYQTSLKWVINGDDSKTVPDITYLDIINSLNRKLKDREIEIQIE